MSIRLAVAALSAAVVGGAALAQEAAKPVAPPAPAVPAAKPATAAKPPPPAPPTRPGLLYKEVWKQNPKGDELPLDPVKSLSNPDLILTLHGPGVDLTITGVDGDDSFPTHIWNGSSKGASAFTFKHKKSFLDLTGLGRVKLNAKVSGFHRVYPIVKLADGVWWLGDRAVGTSTHDFNLEEITFADVHWTKLDIATVTTKGNPVEKLDLAKVDELGFADLIPGSGHGPGGWIDVGQVEVYGKAVAR
jgi:hypothetical protein